jgi:hypothetical protein
MPGESFITTDSGDLRILSTSSRRYYCVQKRETKDSLSKYMRIGIFSLNKAGRREKMFITIGQMHMI